MNKEKKREEMKNEDDDLFKAKSSFQNHLSLTLFNLKIYVVFNNVMAVATFSSLDEFVDERKESQLLATRYFFSQFWCEFTSDVLQEFYHEDVIYRQQEIDTTTALKKLEHLDEITKKKEMMKIMENKSSIFQKDEITKRNFYL